MKACIATVRLLIDTDDPDMACDGISALLTERMQRYEPKSSLIDWQYEYGGPPVVIDITDNYAPYEDDMPEHPWIEVVGK